MGLTRQEAFSILDVPKGSSEDEIRSAYKKLALKWHPDKHANSDEATKKFQDISAAYKRLTSEDELSEIIITPEDMFDLFAQMFFGQRTFRSNGFFYADDSSDDDNDDESDDDSNDGHGKFSFSTSYPFPPSSSSKKRATLFSYTARRPTASEASKNADELMKEEERQQKQREKKKNKKKRQKEKRRLEKEKKEQEDEKKRKLEERKREEVERARKFAEEEDSSSESDDEKENVIKIETSKTSNNTKNTNSKKASSNINNLTNGNMPSSGRGDATVNKKPTQTTNDTKSNPSTSDKKSNPSTSDKKPNTASTSSDKKSTSNDKKSTPTRKSKKEPAHNHITPSSDSENDPEETTGLDPTSAFFVNAAATASKKINSQPQPKPKKEKDDKNKINGKKKTEDAESIEDMDPVILRSRQMAVKGNEMANLGHFTAAVELFTQAIQLNPRDFRFFGNRSFCFDRLDKYDKALKDAEKAITLAKDWPKGYFRKGRALSGLRLYAKAENAFEQVLKLDKNCEEAVEELRRVRGYQLMEMGFTRQQSEAAIRQYGTVQNALEVLLVQGGSPGEISSQAFGEDVYLSDDEDYITETIEQSKTDVGNPEGLRSIWVGNVQATVSEKELRDLFGQFGEIQSVRRLQEKFCCFINFKKATQAAIAMAQLQGQELHGRFLLIKFPDNPIIEGQPRTTVLKKKETQPQPQPQQPKQKQPKQTKQQQQQQPVVKVPKQSPLQQSNGLAQDKLTGPVNGDECYFWRTTGCAFGERCKYKHLMASKGLDRKSWQKPLYKN